MVNFDKHSWLSSESRASNDLKGDKERDVCLQTLRTPGLYAEIKIANITRVPEAQKAALRMLGAVDETIPTPSLTA